ncbi:MAG: sulfatase-like hydrolase/transferase, partial [Fimbriimonadaceae bacterium]
RPFFLYLAHSMPHVPIAASPRFLGASRAGLYGDTIQEIDWSVGEVLKTIKANGLTKNTLVVFSSDNGPWRPYGNHAGSPGGLREGKGTTFEAGFRVPGIFWQPGKVLANRVNKEMASTMDVLPTFAAMARSGLPKSKIDGHDIAPLLIDANAKSPWKWFYYFWPSELQAVRSGDWKLHVAHSHRHQTPPAGVDGKPAGEVTERIELSLYNLKDDPSEDHNVAEAHPEIVDKLMRMIRVGRAELGDSLRKVTGNEVRPPGMVFPKGSY